MAVFKKHVKLFSEGFFNKRKYTREELEDAVKAQIYLKEFALPDLKISHAESKEKRDELYPILKNLPFTVGKIDNFSLEKENKKAVLFGDYINVFEPIKNMINDNLLTTHSAELYTDVELMNGNKYKIVITAISFVPAGELPALFEVFTPYMYSLDKSNESDLNKESEDSEQKQQKDLFKNFTYKTKEIFYFTEPQEVSDMNKTRFEKLAKKYTAKTGKACMSFEDWQATEEVSREAFLDLLYDSVDGEDPEMAQPTEQEKPSVINNTVDVSKKIVDLEKQFFALAQKNVNRDNERLKVLEDVVKDFKKKEKEEKVLTFIKEISDPSSPKIPKKMEEMVKTLLMSTDSDKKINFSFDDKTEFSQEELVKALLTSLPVINAKTTKEVFESDGIKIDDLVRGEYEEGVSDEQILQDKKIKKFALDKNISYDEAYIQLGCM